MADDSAGNNRPVGYGHPPVGKPFEKGKSGNPSGAPKWLKAVRAQLRGLTPLAAETLRGVLEEGEDKDKVAASRVVLEYTVPKPKQTMKVEGGGKDPLSDLTAEALVAFIKNGGGK